MVREAAAAPPLPELRAGITNYTIKGNDEYSTHTYMATDQNKITMFNKTITGMMEFA